MNPEQCFQLFGISSLQNIICRCKESYEKSKEAYDQQLLAFYLAYRNKAKGYLIDLFKKKYLKQAKQREDELINKFLKV